MITMQEILIPAGTAAGTFKNVNGILHAVRSTGRTASLSIVGGQGQSILGSTAMSSAGTSVAQSSLVIDVNVGDVVATYSGTTNAATLRLYYEV